MRATADTTPDVETRYCSDALLMCDWIDTTNFVVVGGRGVAKSTVIIARRTERCVRLMPGAPVAVVANTYSNLVDNIMPAVQNGWRKNALIEGVHYIKGKRPPEEWRRRCSVIVDDYRHVYSFWNGSVIFLGSLDNPSLLAGKSVAHLFFDEAKYASSQKASRVMPILRGDAITYGGCHLYGGVTITTDMPDISEGEHDWFFRYASEMDPERIIRIIQCAGELNRLLRRMVREESAARPDVAAIRRLERKVDYYRAGLRKMRKGQTFFTNISSVVNIDILTVDYLRRLYNGALEPHEFMKSVFGMRPGLRRDARFYVLFGDRHKYYDGTLSSEAAFSSVELRYLDPDAELDAGMDFGNMISMVVAQKSAGYYRIHKNLYELPPGWYREMADQFLAFFASHRCKVLNLYYDRAGNNYQRQGEDAASKMKAAIERDVTGTPTGWTVRLMSRRQGIIRQHEEYGFMQAVMKEDDRRLPRLRVDALNCAEMVSSLELARSAVKYKGQMKIVAKVKKSEKLPVAKLPRLSTNFSDAFKYLMMRREWRAIVTGVRKGAGASTRAADEWIESRYGSG